MENASSRYSADEIKAKIKRQTERYGWEFIFLAANIDAVNTAARICIRKDRAANYRQTQKGVKRSYFAMSEDGIPVLFAYTCDLYRIEKLNNGLLRHEQRGIIYCFEYQAKVLRGCCSDLVEIEPLSYEKVKKKYFVKT